MEQDLKEFKRHIERVRKRERLLGVHRYRDFENICKRPCDTIIESLYYFDRLYNTEREI